MHLADRLVVMDQGRVVGFGTFLELKEGGFLEKVLAIHAAQLKENENSAKNTRKWYEIPINKKLDCGN